MVVYTQQNKQIESASQAISKSNITNKRTEGHIQILNPIKAQNTHGELRSLSEDLGNKKQKAMCIH